MTLSFSTEWPDRMGKLALCTLHSALCTAPAFLLLYFNENFTGKLIHWTDLKY